MCPSKYHSLNTHQHSDIIYITVRFIFLSFLFCLYNAFFLENVMITLPESCPFYKICLEFYHIFPTLSEIIFTLDCSQGHRGHVRAQLIPFAFHGNLFSLFLRVRINFSTQSLSAPINRKPQNGGLQTTEINSPSSGSQNSTIRVPAAQVGPTSGSQASGLLAWRKG